MPLTPDTALASVPKVSRRILPALKRLGITSIKDLLFYFPSRYEDFSLRKNIADLILGEAATVEATVRRVTQGRTARRHMHILEALVEDESGRITATWFNQPFLARNIKEGAAVRLSGKVGQGPKGMYLQNPAYERAAANETHTGGLIPVYPETEGMTS
ncbi:MAG: ATP-dependent DNA helicase RecG, partial [Parcubacteria group bacterium Greene0714_36]